MKLDNSTLGLYGNDLIDVGMVDIPSDNGLRSPNLKEKEVDGKVVQVRLDCMEYVIEKICDEIGPELIRPPEKNDKEYGKKVSEILEEENVFMLGYERNGDKGILGFFRPLIYSTDDPVALDSVVKKYVKRIADHTFGPNFSKTNNGKRDVFGMYVRRPDNYKSFVQVPKSL